MTKDVLVLIRGMQFSTGEDGEKIESIQRGEYYVKGDTHYILYEEIIEGVEERVKNMIKFLPGEMHLTKRGPINVHMDFVEKQKNHTDYRTPYGSIVIGLEASKVTLEEEEKRMVLQVDYTLDVNYEYLADCKIHVDIRSLDGEQFSLRE